MTSRTPRNPKYNTRITQVTIDAVILPRGEWRRAKKEAVYLTPSQILEQQNEKEAQTKRAITAIETKRTRIFEAEKANQERQKRLLTQKTSQEHERQLAIAQAKANEELDEVKMMNAEVAVARVRTIRDAELLLHKQRKQQELERKRKDAQDMENERQRALKIYADRERMLKEQRAMGGKVILEQIEEKKRRQKIEDQHHQEEMAKMKIEYQRALDEEQKLAKEYKQRQQEFLSECLEANKVAIRRKQADRQREIEETNSIVAYQQAKAAREEEWERKKEEEKRQKELETANLRKQQQRLMDTRAQEDELRERRAWAQKEKAEMQKELELRRKKEMEREEMRKNREDFLRLKQLRFVQLARQEREEFERARKANEEARRKEREEAEAKRKRDEDYNRILTDEINARWLRRKMEPLTNLDEQRHIEEEQADYMERIEEIRQQKLEMLRAEGVPERYLMDLKNKRFVLK